MELINIEKSQLLKLGMVSKPDGQFHVPWLIESIRKRFAFSEAPKVLEETKNGMEFNYGISGDIAIDKLGIYSDGVVIQARSPTKQLDAFLEDLMNWATGELGVAVVKTLAIDTLYESNVVVHSTKNISKMMTKLEKIQAALRKTLFAVSKIDVPFEMAGFTMAPDFQKISGLRPASFRLSRHSGADFDSNLYQSTAPLPTDDHIKFLKLIEDISH